MMAILALRMTSARMGVAMGHSRNAMMVTLVRMTPAIPLPVSVSTPTTLCHVMTVIRVLRMTFARMGVVLEYPRTVMMAILVRTTPVILSLVNVSTPTVNAST